MPIRRPQSSWTSPIPRIALFSKSRIQLRPSHFAIVLHVGGPYSHLAVFSVACVFHLPGISPEAPLHISFHLTQSTHDNSNAHGTCRWLLAAREDPSWFTRPRAVAAARVCPVLCMSSWPRALGKALGLAFLGPFSPLPLAFARVCRIPCKCLLPKGPMELFVIVY